jgi:hypothetical protein
MYNYSSPGFSSATGHFTQVVWSDSIQLGIGIAFTSNNQAAYAVANYYPPGNFLGQFATEVPPLCVTTTTAGTTVGTGVTTTTAGTTVGTGVTTMTTKRSNNSAVTTAGQRTFLSLAVVILASLFRLFSN